MLGRATRTTRAGDIRIVERHYAALEKYDRGGSMTTGTLAIGQVQINNSFSGQSYLPYSVGALQAFVQRHARDPSRFDFRMPVYRRMPARQAVEQLLGVDVAGFSLYVWNANISLEIARRLKALRP